MRILLVFCLLAFSLFAQKAELQSPRVAMKHFLTNMKMFKKGDVQAINQAIEVIPLDHFDDRTKIESGKLAAQKLINIIDRLEFVKYDSIPEQTDEQKWYFRNETLKINENLIAVEIALAFTEKIGWRFSYDTLKALDAYESYLKNRDTVAGVVELKSWRDGIKKSAPAWMSNKALGIHVGQWIALLLLLFLSFIFERISRIFIGSRVVAFLQGQNVPLSDKQKKSFTLPFGILAISVVWQLGVVNLELPDSWLSVLVRFGEIVFTLGFVGILYHLVVIVSYYFETKSNETASKFDDILVPLLSKAAIIVVWSIGLVLVCQSFNLDVTNLVAGLGIGGLAFAFAAKDTLSNIFGSLTVILDKPFEIGDWVNIGGSVEGTVEAVGFRSTRVRTFYDSLITVPNNTLTNTHIDNYGKRKYRRFSTTVSVTYDTPAEKIEAFCEAIRQLIAKHKWTRKDYFHVYLNKMGASSLDILLYVFWRVPDWSQELNERHRLLLDILRLGKELDVEFAFPTQTLYVQQLENPEKQPLKDDIFSTGKVAANNLMGKQFIKEQPRSADKQILD